MIGVGFPHKVGLVFWETRVTQWKIFYFDGEGEHGAVEGVRRLGSLAHNMEVMG